MAATKSKADSGLDFAPYVPPCYRESGPVNPAIDLLHRVSDGKHVTPQVVAVVAWALTHFYIFPTEDTRTKKRMTLKEHEEAETQKLLDDLGLEWKEMPMGGTRLQPKTVQPVKFTKSQARAALKKLEPEVASVMERTK
jgi:hypothetical protein